jgi:uncharacterized protein YndB with AHSA1/START domain
MDEFASFIRLRFRRGHYLPALPVRKPLYNPPDSAGIFLCGMRDVSAIFERHGRGGTSMKWILVAAGILVAAILIVVIVGAFLPKEHTATRAARYHQPPPAVWQAITDYDKFPQWRGSVERVEPLPQANGKSGWVEYVKGAGRIPLEITESVPPSRLVTLIADPNLPFGGTWTYEITAVEGGSLVRVTENGEVRNPIFRFVSRFIFGLHATMDQYLKDLGAKFGETVNLEN